jgi:uncharacterized protein YjbJ (UPF0337 family)
MLIGPFARRVALARAACYPATTPVGALARHMRCVPDVGRNRPVLETKRGDSTMDSDRIEGGMKEATGKVKEEWGDVTDDPGTEAEGQAQQVEGDVQEDWGEAKDNARDALDDDVV